MKHSRTKHPLLAMFLGATLHLNLSSVIAAEPPAVRLTGPETMVYDSTKDGCGPDDISDAPFRAVRLKNGDVLAGASWRTNHLFRGKDLNWLSKDCHSAYTSAHRGDPAVFDDWSWLMTFWTDDGQKIYALAHHEYQAQQFSGKCAFLKQTQCTYNAITAFESDDEGRSFHRASREPVAAPRSLQSPMIGRTIGFLHPSNIIQSDGFRYFIAQANADGDQRAGECLFRSRDLAEPGDWVYLTESGWTKSSFSAYENHSAPLPCKPLPRLGGIVWSLLKYESAGVFVVLLTVPSDHPNRTALAVSISSDLTTWSSPQLFYSFVSAWNDDCSLRYRYNYPSLLDPASPSRNFETIGARPTLYMTRIDTERCRQTMRRDVVAVPVNLR